MSETYLVPGNTLLKINPGEWAAQSFSPLETHTLEYLDLELFYWADFADHLYEIYALSPAGFPAGDPISTGTISEPSIPSKILTRRYRFKMTLVTLYMGTNYAAVIRVKPAEPLFTIFWQYQKDTGAYPRGRRLWSGNDGITWAYYNDNDHIFGEFGTPPLPRPEPPPPIENFAITDISYLHNPTSITITIPTSVPCHLTCYHTDKQPLKHHTSAIVRGLSVPWDTYFCFVAWSSIQQDEEGDTLYHTFQIPDWSYCQTKWFTFRGNVSALLSPSVGPIFMHHHSGVVPPDTEQQLLHDTDLSYNLYIRPSGGQRLTIPNRTVKTLSFILRKVGSPTGPVTFIIKTFPGDITLLSKVLADASTLQPGNTWEQVIFDTPLLINQEVKIYCHHVGGTPTDFVVFRYQTSDVKPSEHLVYEEGPFGWFPPGWYEASGADATYKYTYQ